MLALGYAAACRDDWERAAELLGAAADELLRDTAGFIHHALLREQLVRPRLEPEAFTAATARGQQLRLGDLLADLCADRPHPLVISSSCGWRGRAARGRSRASG